MSQFNQKTIDPLNDINSDLRLYNAIPLIANRWRTDEPLGKGVFGQVFAATDIRGTGEIAAAKLESVHSNQYSIRDEIEVYKALECFSSKTTGFAQVLFHGREGAFDVIVMTRLGPSLKHLLEQAGGTFSASKALTIGMQLVTRIEQLHRAGYSHEDISPKNILIGKADPNVLYLIDFGISRKLSSDWTGSESRRHDLLSLGLNLVEICSGRFPRSWGGESEDWPRDFLDEVEELCSEDIPEVCEYFEMVSVFDFEQSGDYERLRELFRVGLSNRGCDRPIIFD